MFCGDEEYHTRIAALGAVAYLTSDVRICKCIINIGSFEEIVKETICIEDQGQLVRLFVCLSVYLSPRLLFIFLIVAKLIIKFST